MQLIRCTGKLRKEMGLKAADLSDESPCPEGLGVWHANLIYVDRKKCVLFTNDRTLINFIVPNLKRKEIRDLAGVFRSWLSPVLGQEGVSANDRERLLSEYEEIGFGKSNNKSTLGSMNDFAYRYEYAILKDGGIFTPTLPRIIHAMNNMPVGAVDMNFPSDELKKFLAETNA